MNFNYVGGRTYLLVLLSLTGLMLLKWVAKIDDATFGLAFGGTVGAYIGGTTFRDHSATKAETQVDIARIQATAPTTL